VQVYGGIQALSNFRQRKLLSQLKQIASSITAVEAEYLHIVDAPKTQSAAADEQLKQLLTYDEPFNGNRSGKLFVVTPRLGTISPWSSKATDIAINSGLTSIRRIERVTAYYVRTKKALPRQQVSAPLHDRMTETVFDSIKAASTILTQTNPRRLSTVDVLHKGAAALKTKTLGLGMAISDDEIDYLVRAYKKLKRNPTDTELMMFAQVNSEHCRHKIFNADWVIDGVEQPKSLFKMIKNTYEKGGQDVITAYSDNAAVVRGPLGERFSPNPKTHVYSSYRADSSRS
jgi:phosphoribosylformylglycinamidine synthase